METNTTFGITIDTTKPITFTPATFEQECAYKKLTLKRYGVWYFCLFRLLGGKSNPDYYWILEGARLDRRLRSSKERRKVR